MITNNELRNYYLNFGHSAHSSDKDDFTDVGFADFGILHGLVTGVDGLFDQVADNRFELGARQLEIKTCQVSVTILKS